MQAYEAAVAAEEAAEQGRLADAAEHHQKAAELFAAAASAAGSGAGAHSLLLLQADHAKKARRCRESAERVRELRARAAEVAARKARGKEGEEGVAGAARRVGAAPRRVAEAGADGGDDARAAAASRAAAVAELDQQQRNAAAARLSILAGDLDRREADVMGMQRRMPAAVLSHAQASPVPGRSGRGQLGGSFYIVPDDGASASPTEVAGKEVPQRARSRRQSAPMLPRERGTAPQMPTVGEESEVAAPDGAATGMAQPTQAPASAAGTSPPAPTTMHLARASSDGAGHTTMQDMATELDSLRRQVTPLRDTVRSLMEENAKLTTELRAAKAVARNAEQVRAEASAFRREFTAKFAGLRRVMATYRHLYGQATWDPTTGSYTSGSGRLSGHSEQSDESRPRSLRDSTSGGDAASTLKVISELRSTVSQLSSKLREAMLAGRRREDELRRYKTFYERYERKKRRPTSRRSLHAADETKAIAAAEASDKIAEQRATTLRILASSSAPSALKTPGGGKNAATSGGNDAAADVSADVASTRRDRRTVSEPPRPDEALLSTSPLPPAEADATKPSNPEAERKSAPTTSNPRGEYSSWASAVLRPRHAREDEHPPTASNAGSTPEPDDTDAEHGVALGDLDIEELGGSHGALPALAEEDDRRGVYDDEFDEMTESALEEMGSYPMNLPFAATP